MKRTLMIIGIFLSTILIAYANQQFNRNDVIGVVQVTPLPTYTFTLTSTPSFTPTPTFTGTASPNVWASYTPTPTFTVTSTYTNTPTVNPLTPTVTPTPFRNADTGISKTDSPVTVTATGNYYFPVPGSFVPKNVCFNVNCISATGSVTCGGFNEVACNTCLNGSNVFLGAAMTLTSTSSAAASQYAWCSNGQSNIATAPNYFLTEPYITFNVSGISAGATISFTPMWSR